MHQILQVQVLDVAIGVLTPAIAVGHDLDHGPDEPSGVEFLTEFIPHVADRDLRLLLLLLIVQVATVALVLIIIDTTTGQ